MIESRLRAGKWQRLYAGVFATFTGQPPRLCALWAAVLRAGAGAVLSHDTAAELAGLIDNPDRHAPIHVTIPARRRMNRLRGIVVHRSSRVDAARHPSRMPPQTRLEDTVVDLIQASRSLENAMSWVAQAVAKRLTTPVRLSTAFDNRQRLRWRAELREALRDVAHGCHSLIELHYVRDVERAHGLPPGERQVAEIRDFGKIYHDVLYLRYGTVVELDGRAAHTEAQRWRDMRRDNATAVEGKTILRYGSVDVACSPCHVAVQIALVLRRNGWHGTPRPCGPGCVVAESFPAYRGEESPRR